MSDAATQRFESLWAACHVRVRGYIARRCAHDDCDDILSATFTVAWRRLDVVPDGEAALWWLLATARGVLSNHYRSQRRSRALVERVGAHSPPSTDQRVPTGPVDDPLVDAALHAVRPDDREVLMLSVWDELSAAEIAAVLGISAEAAQKRLTRARDRFREQYLIVSESDDRRTLPG